MSAIRFTRLVLSEPKWAGLLLVVASLLSFWELFAGLPLSFFALVTIFLAMSLGQRMPSSFIIALVVLIGYNTAVLLAPICSGSIGRSLLTVFAVSVLLISVLGIYRSIFHSIDFDKVASTFVLVLFLSLLPEALGLHLSGASGSGILFKEPSHLALSAAPFLAFVFMRRKSLVTLGLACLILAYSFSATIVILVAAAWFLPQTAVFIKQIFGRGIRFRSAAAFIIAGAALYFATSSEHFQDRLAFIASDIPAVQLNLSLLVYLNGWEMAKENLLLTNYLGLGLNRMGCNGSFEGVLGDAIEAISGSRLNFNDGSFLVSKVVSELGVFGILIIALLSGFLLNRLLRIKSYDLSDPQTAMAFCFLSSATTAMFIRSAGYFGARDRLLPWLPA